MVKKISEIKNKAKQSAPVKHTGFSFLLLCSEQNESVIKYSVLKESKHLFSSRYKLFLPSEKELKKELDRERLLIEQQIKRSKQKK
jgi:hypothetical protein